jgi:hypothetical protein
MHSISLSILDIFFHSVASWFELVGARRAPQHPAILGILGIPAPPSNYHLDKVDEEKPLC